MASCRVPDFPAVTFALEHLKELDEQLSEGGGGGGGLLFSRETSLHLTEVAAAVTELEADRRAAREHLEVETIENSKLRHHVDHVRERVSQEMVADAAAARASDAEDVEHLQRELDKVSETQEATAERQEALWSQNQVLQAERELLRAEHGGAVAALNHHITIKYGAQVQREQTAERTEELRSRTAAAARDTVTLQRDTALVREAFTVKRDQLSREMHRIDGEVERLKRAVGRSRRDLDGVNGRKREARDRLEELVSHVARLEGELRTQTASRRQRVEQLEGENLRREELRRRGGGLEKELRALREDLGVTVRRLREETTTVEGKVEEERASRGRRQDDVSQVYETFERQHDEEQAVRAEHLHVCRQLERSKRQLEEHVASIVRHRSEVRKMEEQIAELLEVNAINRRVFGRSREEMNVNVDVERRSIDRYEEEKERLKRLLEEEKTKQEEHVVKVTRDTDGIRRRYQDLQREEAVLQRQPESADTDLLMGHVTRCEAEHRGRERRLHQEMERCDAETESITRSTEEAQREVEEEEERLKEAEARWSQERCRHRRLETETSDLRRRRSHLERSNRGLEEKIGSLLEPKEKMKVELEETRERHMEVLHQQASELRAVEMSVYDSRAKLEEVRLENSRLHLRVRQMTDDLGRAGEDRDRYGQESRRVGRDTRATAERLHEAWREDAAVTDHCRSSDDALLGLMSAAIDYLKTRSEEVGNVGARLHRLMSDFSRRLGRDVSADAWRPR